MKTLRILIMMMTTMLCTAYGYAQSVSVQVATQVEEGRKFQLTISLKDIEANAPQKIELQNCTFLYGPAYSTSSSFTSINGKTTSSSSINATYTFKADKASTITIPAFTVTASDGKKYSTQQKKLTILPAGQRPSQGSSQSNHAIDIPDGSRINTDGHFSADDMFVRINVDKHSVYEQEPVVATIKLYTHQNIRSFQMLTQPTFEGFLSEELEVNDPMGTEMLNGKEYRTAVLKRCVLYPQKAGKLKLSSGTYEVTLIDRVNVNSGSFFPDFRTVEKQIRTPENVANISVSALPEPKPESFDGAVGTFTAERTLSTDILRTNEPATLTYKISGTGNIKYLTTPSLKMPPGIDLYTPKTDINATYSRGDMSGTYTVTYTFMPQEVGTFHIEPAQFTYFNPKTKEYKTIELKGFDIKVAKGVSSSVTEQKTIAKGITDILHIKPIKSPLTKNPTFVYHKIWYWGLYLALLAILLASIIVYRRQIKLNADVRGRQLARALRKAMKRFKTAKALMHAHESEKFYAEISKALWGYLSDKLGIPSSQLLRENISSQLTNYGVDAAGIDNIITILDECEMARFTPMHTDTDMAQLYEKVVNAVKSIENVKTK